MTDFNDTELQSSVKQEYIRTMQENHAEYLKIMEELAWARVVIRELSDRLAKLEKK